MRAEITELRQRVVALEAGQAELAKNTVVKGELVRNAWSCEWIR